MKIWKRIRYYLIGVGVGTLMMLVMFRGKGCSWLPENRVLEDIEKSEIRMTEKMKCLLNCNEISDLSLFELFSDKLGSVIFSESEPRENPKMYIIESEDPLYKIKVYMYQSYAVISELHLQSKKSCNCDVISDTSMIVFNMPVEKIKKNLFQSTGKELKCSACLLECHQLNEEDISIFIDNPRYLKEESNPDQIPNPLFVFENEIKGETYKFSFEDSERRTRVVKIEKNGKSCDCH